MQNSEQHDYSTRLERRTPTDVLHREQLIARSVNLIGIAHDVRHAAQPSRPALELVTPPVPVQFEQPQVTESVSHTGSDDDDQQQRITQARAETAQIFEDSQKPQIEEIYDAQKAA